MVTLSNSAVLADKEIISGKLGGIDFGHDLRCVARAPETMLLWSAGGSYWSGGYTHYARSGLYLIQNRRQSNWGMTGSRRDYRRIGPEGGRLTVHRIKIVSEELAAAFGKAFGTDPIPAIEAAVAEGKTLIIEGGGFPPQPGRKGGFEAYSAWRARATAEGMTGV